MPNKKNCPSRGQVFFLLISWKRREENEILLYNYHMTLNSTLNQKRNLQHELNFAVQFHDQTFMILQIQTKQRPGLSWHIYVCTLFFADIVQCQSLHCPRHAAELVS